MDRVGEFPPLDVDCLPEDVGDFPLYDEVTPVKVGDFPLNDEVTPVEVGDFHLLDDIIEECFGPELGYFPFEMSLSAKFSEPASTTVT